jgi:hypothetical protein
MKDDYHGERWHVRIDGWQPTTLNTLTNCHWATRNRLKKHDAAIIKVSCLGADVPQAETARRVSLEIVLGPRQRGADRDAYWKTTLDALVKCGALVDDSPAWCELGEVTYRRGERRGCVIVLENLRAEKLPAKADEVRERKTRNKLHRLRLVNAD